MTKRKNIIPYNVINFDFNNKKMESYDIMPYLVQCYYDKKKKRKELPITFEEFKEFVKSNSQYMYWARCEYEIIISDWPCKQTWEKIDIHYQIMLNIDIVTKILMENVK